MQFSLEQIQSLTGEVGDNPGTPAATNGETNSDLPAISTLRPESEDEAESKAHSDSENGGRSAGSTPGATSKLKKAVKLKIPGLAQQRKAERERASQEKANQIETSRLEEEVAEHDNRLRNVDQEFRSVMNSTRIRPIGKDRFFCRYWWLDGLGGASCTTGKVYIQKPSELDQEVLVKREAAGEQIQAKMSQELGEEYLKVFINGWGYYSTEDEVIYIVCLLSQILITIAAR